MRMLLCAAAAGTLVKRAGGWRIAMLSIHNQMAPGPERQGEQVPRVPRDTLTHRPSRDKRSQCCGLRGGLRLTRTHQEPI